MPERAPTFSAVLLAGGKSTRMGSDKALLVAPGSSLPLWQAQLRTLERLQPARIFWSGPARPGLPAHLHQITDAIPNAGPLAGISAALDALENDLLVVLAIDLPGMTSTFLSSLLMHCTTQAGAVAQNGRFFEPLAAVYPKVLAGLAREHLKAGRHALQDFIREALPGNHLVTFPLSETEALLFKNLNSPADLKS